MSKLKQTILGQEHTPFLYEVIPPQADSSPEKINRIVDTLLEGLCKTKIDGINIPEILDAKTPKMEPRVYGKIIRERSKTKIDIIINRVIVMHPLQTQLNWLEETKTKFGIDAVVLVGGAHQTISYPGPSVPEFIRTAQGCAWGGILIPHRHKKDTGQHEADRAISKTKAGLDFFTSQVLYESEHTKHFLKEYYQKCQEQKLMPKRVFLSFAPVSQPADLAFLKDLGVIVPAEVEKDLCGKPDDMTRQSIRVIEDLFLDILSACESQNINIPLGINVEYVTRHNRKGSFELIQRLKTLVKNRKPTSQRDAS